MHKIPDAKLTMPESGTIENEFLSKATAIIEENLSNEQFGVSELANEMGMSRSNLLRKVKKLTNLSASQFIRQVRLDAAMELLKETSLTTSEISYRVGFGSTSYFIKCFRDQYGYPPGEAKGKASAEEEPDRADLPKKKRSLVWLWAVILVVITANIIYLIIGPMAQKPKTQEKSIAVLPFINDSNDSTNVYIINGVMESILNNLQNIKHMRVISRTSVEKYRHHPELISEIAKELNVTYVVEGSGQKIGDHIRLNVQLIEANGDKHLWAEQYNRETKDIFSLQNEIAKNIAEKIEVIITPEERKRIDKVPTKNLVAYDYFLKGMDYFHEGTGEGLKKALPLFQKAVEHDPKFARAYADIAIAYYYLDINQTHKQYSEEINENADKALLYDAQLPQSLIAKALSYMHGKEYKLAEPYLQKALEYHPNSAIVINLLSDFYSTYSPNTEKYLEYALKGTQLNIAANDSVTASFIFLHISNAFIQSGFVNEAEKYINKSLAYHSDNLYSQYVKAYIQYARNPDLQKLRNRLIAVLKKDTTRLDVLQEVGKICYYQRDYESAYRYYKPFIAAKEKYHLAIFPGEDAKIGLVLAKVGQTAKAAEYLQNYKAFAEGDQSIYKHLSLAMYEAYEGNTAKAIEQLKLFSQQDDYHYWVVLFLKIDPLIDNVKDNPDFKKILHTIDSRFQNQHREMKASLEAKGVI
ncbi:helix-turn-helix domain-containing protein [Prolixibacter bellariivorans]|nr:helix-turn-helix domain-containing protein [Prolixibacter bellariivorans]